MSTTRGLMMSLVIFICPENQYLSKYCEAFYNHINFGYIRNNSTYTYGGGTTIGRKKVALARLPKKKNHPDKLPMKATDPTLDRIYKKVITNDCYDHSYYQIVDTELEKADLIVYMTDNNKPKHIAKYLFTCRKPMVVWKFTNVKLVTNAKFGLVEKLIRKMLKTAS
jgi:hypothetical protein